MGIGYIPYFRILSGKYYVCCLCESKFKIRGKFAIHFYQVHKEKTLICDSCDKRFAHCSFMKFHLKRCKGKLYPKCITKEKITYKIIQSKDKMENIQCLICNEAFESIASFHSHYSYNEKEKNLCRLKSYVSLFILLNWGNGR